MSPLRKERHTNGRLIDNEGRAEEVDKKKQEHLNKQKEGKGHWEEQLASDSESAVRLSAHAHFPSPDNMKYAQTRERESLLTSDITGQGGSIRDGTGH